jgi:hypothetical protein
MSAFWDISVNLLSNAIWAMGGYGMSQLLLKKISFSGANQKVDSLMHFPGKN